MALVPGQIFSRDLIILQNTGRPGDVVMMSLGGYDVSSCERSNPSLFSAIQELANSGMFIVMSAGNDQGDANLNLPGCINGPNVFTVAALDFDCSTGITGCASYSNYGKPAVDWAAPGSAIISTWPGRQYQVMSGTSMACALVAGIIHARRGSTCKQWHSRLQWNGLSDSIAVIREQKHLQNVNDPYYSGKLIFSLWQA